MANLHVVYRLWLGWGWHHPLSVVTVTFRNKTKYLENCKWVGNGLCWLLLAAMPSSPPVFDYLQYANTMAEGLGDLVMCGQMVDTKKGGNVRTTLFWSIPATLEDKGYWCCLANPHQPSTFGQALQEMALRSSFGHCPLCVCPLSAWHYARDQISY